MSSTQTHKNEFLIIRFQALRKEILGIKKRVIRLQLIGVTGIPLVIGAGEKFELSAILMASPLITLIFTLMLVFEQNSLMRVGKYIKDHIEPKMLQPKEIGWERWLEENPVRRRAEAFFAWSAYIAFSVYFVIGTYLAYLMIEARISALFASLGISVYFACYLFALYLVVTNLRTNTTKSM